MRHFFDWLAMGGYSLYVWPAYGLVCFVLAMNFFAVKWKKKQTQRRLKQWLKKHESSAST